jgi:hypothetical protein
MWQYIYIYAMLLQFRKQQCFLEGSQVSPVRPSDKSGIEMQMSVKHWWNDTDRGHRSTGRKSCPTIRGVTWGERNKRGKCPTPKMFST